MNTENTEIAKTEALESTVVELSIGDRKLEVTPSDFLTDIKSGRTFVSKKSFREKYGLTSSQTNKFYGICREKFGKAWAVAEKAKMELDNWSIRKMGKERVLKDGTVVQTMTREKPGTVTKAEPSMTPSEMVDKLGLPDAVKDIVMAALSKKSEGAIDVEAVEA